MSAAVGKRTKKPTPLEARLAELRKAAEALVRFDRVDVRLLKCLVQFALSRVDATGATRSDDDIHVVRDLKCGIEGLVGDLGIGMSPPWWRMFHDDVAPTMPVDRMITARVRVQQFLRDAIENARPEEVGDGEE